MARGGTGGRKRCRVAKDAVDGRLAAVPLLVLALALLAVFGVVLSRANELFVLSARGGRVLLLRGKLPRDLERELSAILRGAGATGQLRAVRQGGQTRLVGRGLPTAVEQRLRNVFFASRFAEMRWLAAPDPRPKNLGQRLGWDWLAWRLASERSQAPLRLVDEEEDNGPLPPRTPGDG